MQISNVSNQDIVHVDADIETLSKTSWILHYKKTSSSVQTALHLNVHWKSNRSASLKYLLLTFGDEPFMGYQAQGCDQFELVSASQKNCAILSTVERFLCNSVEAYQNTISSHVFYSIKSEDIFFLYFRSRTALHGN